MPGTTRGSDACKAAFRAALACLLAACAGCESPGTRPGPEHGAAVQHPLLEGIPLPAGFSLVDNQSVGRATGSLRVAQCMFTGDVERGAVLRFFQQRMPAAGWSLQEQRFKDGVYDLRYESQREACSVSIKRERLRTVLVVDVGPLPQAAAGPHEPTAAGPHKPAAVLPPE